MRIMLEEDERAGGTVLDHAFIRERTEGFENFAHDLKAEDWPAILKGPTGQFPAAKLAPDFFDQVVLHRDIFSGAPGGHGHRKCMGGVLGNAERQPFQDVPHFMGSNVLADLAHQPAHGQQNRRRRRNGLAPIGEAAHQADARRDFPQQLDGARQAAHGIRRVLGFLEAHRSVGAQLQCGRRAPHTRGVEARAFQDDAGSARGDGAILAADHAGQGDRAIGIGNRQVRPAQREILIVQSAEIFAFMRAADENRIAVEQVAIEGVHGLRQLGHDEVGHVHNVVDGVQSDGRQPVLQPQRRRLHGDVVEDQRAITRAKIEVFNLHLDVRGPVRNERRIDRIG